MTTKLSVEDFLKFVKESRSKATHKEYKHGVEKFSEWFGKSPNEILAMRASDWKSDDVHVKRRFGREIEKFHKHLIEKGYTINTARTLTLGIIQLFRFYEMPVTYLSPEVSKTVPTTKTFVPTVEQLRAMFRVADSLRDKIIICMAKDLGWRIGDFVSLKKADLPDLDVEPPLAYELISEKEKVIAKSFLSGESVALLKDYLVTIENNPNVYLFASNHEGHVDPDTINKMLRDVAQRANVRVPANKRLSFHAFRKRFLTTCADLSIDVNTAKVLVGKDVEDSMLAYLSEVDHKAAFVLVSEKLRLTDLPKATRTETESQSEQAAKIERLEKMINVIAALDPNIVRNARAFVETNLVNLGKWKLTLDKPVGDMGDTEVLATFWKMIEQAELTKITEQRQEYGRLIESNNGDNGNGAS